MKRDPAAPMRIAMVTFDWYPFDVLIHRMTHVAVEAGCEVTIICLRQDHEPSFEVVEGVPIYRLDGSRDVGRSLVALIESWVRFTWQAGRLLSRLHRGRPFDVAHIHNMPDFLVFAGLPVKLRGAKLVLEVQDVSPELMAAKAHGWKRWVLFSLAALQERISTWVADHVITVGWPFERLLLARGVPPEKLSIILNSADPAMFPADRRTPAPADEGAGGFTVMYWGTVARRNGLDIAVRALALARQEAPDVRLAILGRGEELDKVHVLADELGIAGALTIVDPVPLDQVVDFIIRGDAGIIPYRMDGFADLVLPTKAYELAWMRRPIIAARNPAIASMFREESLMLCTPEDPASFARAIVALRNDPALRHTLVANAAADYAPYRWETMGQRYLDLLGRLRSQKALAAAPAEHAAPVMVVPPAK